jgi:hypothetical protein
MADDNNLDTPEVAGQGEETVKEEPTEKVEEVVKEETAEATTETETVSEESKGIPNDPKLLQKRMTQATQEAAELKGKLEKLSTHPEIKKVLDEIEGKAPEPAKEKTIADLNDEQKAVYANLKPFLDIYTKETGIAEAPKTIAQMREAERLNAINNMVTDFETKNPEIKKPEVRKAVADIIETAGKRGEVVSLDSAWKIYKSDTAESTAKKKVQEELEVKKDISLLKPTGTKAENTVKGKMSAKQAMKEALKAQKKG